MDPSTIFDAFVALGRGEVTAFASLLDDDVVLEFPGSRFGGRFQGKRKVVVFLKRNQRLFRDGLTFHPSWVGVSGDRVIAQWTNQGVTTDGTSYENRGVTIFRVANDRIVEIQDYLDTERLSATWPAPEETS